MTADVLFIGLDSAEPDLIETFAADGTMPNMARLIERGTTVPLRAAEDLPGTAWPELATGRLGARSGIYFPPAQIINGSAALERMTPDYLEKDSWFWVVAAKQGLQVVSIDMVHAALTDCGAAEIVEWGSHDRMISPQGSRPAALLSELEEEHGTYPVHNCDTFHHATNRGYRALRAELVEAAGRKAALTVDVLGRKKWDLFSVVFTETHCACHQLWHFHDQESERHPRRCPEDLAGSYRDVHRAVDDALGAVLDAAGPSSKVVVAAIKGSARAIGGPHLITDVLSALDLAPQRSRKGSLWDAAPVSIKGQLSRVPRSVRARLPLAADPGAGGTPVLARSLRNDQVGAVRLSVAGRDPYGSLEPDDVSVLLNRLEHEFRSLKQVPSGGPVVRDVVALHQTYGEAAHSDLPDLAVVFNTTIGLIETVEGPGVGRLHRPYRRLRSGDHTGSARAWIDAQGIVADPAERAICDVSAAVLKLAGVAVPSTYDGDAGAVIDG